MFRKPGKPLGLRAGFLPLEVLAVLADVVAVRDDPSLIATLDPVRDLDLVVVGREAEAIVENGPASARSRSRRHPASSGFSATLPDRCNVRGSSR